MGPLLDPNFRRLNPMNFFEVGINVFTPEPLAFEELYPGCKVCLRLDGGPWACWAIFEMHGAVSVFWVY